MNKSQELLEKLEASPITKQQLDLLEKYLDALFKSLGVDIEFTGHFLDRVNDARNKTQITIHELTQLFADAYTQKGTKIKGLGNKAQAVLNDIETDINVPFVLEWNKDSGMLELVSKTIMRKKGFKTPDKVFKV